MSLRPTRYRWDEVDLEKVTEMVARKVMTGQETTVVQSYFKKGAIVPVHAHETEQLLYVLQGAIRLHLPGEDLAVREGEVVVLPATLVHQAECLDDTFVVTVIPARR